MKYKNCSVPFCIFISAVLLAGSFLPASVMASGETPRGQEEELRVMSFNIAHGRGMDDIQDLSRTAEVIEDSGAEIIGLQEVDRHWSERSDFEDQAQWLAEELDMHYVYGANLNEEPEEEGEPNRQYGTAVLSEYPIIDSENHLLTQIIEPDGHNEQRGLLEATINVKGTHLKFYNTHIGLKENERLLNVEEILDIMGQSEKYSIIVGDFNAYPGDTEIDMMADNYPDVFAELGKDDAYTFPPYYEDPETGEITEPDARIDYIFADDRLNLLNGEVIQTYYSDHLPIIADFIVERSLPHKNGKQK